MNRSFATALLLALSACVQPEYPEDGVILPSPDAQSWGMLDSAILSADAVLNDNGTTTHVIQILSSAVSDDEMAAAPALICEDLLPTVLSTEVRSPTAQEALADGTLMMIVTCGA